MGLLAIALKKIGWFAGHEDILEFKMTLFTASLLTLVDSATDIVVLYYWRTKEDPDIYWFYFGITSILVSDLISVLMSFASKDNSLHGP